MKRILPVAMTALLSLNGNTEVELCELRGFDHVTMALPTYGLLLKLVKEKQ